MCIDARKAHSGSMDAHHDRKCLTARLVEDGFQNPDDELLRGPVVVVQDDGTLSGFNTDAYGFLASLRDVRTGWSSASGPIVVLVRAAPRARSWSRCSMMARKRSG